MAKKKDKGADAAEQRTEATSTKKERNRVYEKEIARLQVEIAHLQRWLVETARGSSSCSRVATPRARAA